MKLDRLEIHGFKSFADRTTVDFNPGVTAVVGPNGCGKTNISDAIRWVLGEQRPTALRGSSMQDVIFNGSRDRKPLGMAEVTVSFANALGLIPVEYSEVSVTRRVFRDGESEYFLNRTPCNLKDIRDLFMGTGVGSSAYSLIEQRMVDAILSDKAEERRFLFEEAAGVTRYKARRKAALHKLEATEGDLRRLNDILAEVRKTTGSLRRQIGKARRFEILQREELRLAVALARAELTELAAEETPLRDTIRALEQEVARGASEATARDAELERLGRELAGRRAEERELREKLEEGVAGLESLERQRALAEEGRRQATADIERLAREITEHETQARGLLERRGELAGSLSGSAAAAGAARVEAEDRVRAGEEVAARFEAAQAAFRDARAERERLSDERLLVQAEVARARAELEGAALRRSELEAALAALRGDAAGEGSAGGAPGAGAAGAQEERALAAREASLRGLLASTENELGRCGTERADAEAALAALEGELAELAARRREVAARLDTLEEMKEGFTGFGEGARRALEAREAIAPGLRGPLALEVEVGDPRHAPAVEAYLDQFLDALLTAGSEEARAVLEFWRERNHTGAVWPLSDSGSATLPRIDPSAREVLLCRGTEAASLRGELDRYREVLFGRLLLAEDLERATELRRRLNSNGSAGWYVVAALTGEILEPSGMVRLPHPKGEAGGAARFHQAEHLRGSLAEIGAEARCQETRAEELRARAAAAAEDERASRTLVAERAAELGRAVRELERLRGQRGAILTRTAELAADLLAVEERFSRETRLADSATGRAEGIRHRLESAEKEQAEREAAVEALRLERETALRELGGAELAAQQRGAELAALEREERYLAEGEEEQHRAALAKREEVERQCERSLRLEAEAVRLSAGTGERRLEIEELRAEHRRREAAIQTLEAERSSREGEARAARRAHEEAGQRLHVEEMRLSDLIHRRQSIRTVVETEFGRPLEELERTAQSAEPDATSEPARSATPDPLAESAGPDRRPDAATPDPLAGAPELAPEPALALQVAELRERLSDVRERKAALGPVNLLALEEFNTEKERLDFLEAQNADLVQARDQLREAIRRINATARDLFTETFDRARENFRVTFETLFEGGTCDLWLADPSDQLESAIEISASPRGKRIQAVNLLSGGERALAALSLLFAIYLVKPSPFCILDEVDAPLDDANIGRFLRMIRSFSDRIQFVIVTHNKRTMEASDFLYGVTMQEPGVSTLVSVDFERRHSFDYDAIAFDDDAARGEKVSLDDAQQETAPIDAARRERALVGD
jgi:chromosome segregation protein